MSTIRERTVEGLKVGDVFEVKRVFSISDIEQFTVISRDNNPIHSDPDFIHSKKMKEPICHGLLVATMLTEIGGQIGWLASGMDLSFKAPVYPGEEIVCRFKITSIDGKNRATAEVDFFNGQNKIILKASLTGILPNSQERNILKSLL